MANAERAHEIDESHIEAGPGSKGGARQASSTRARATPGESAAEATGSPPSNDKLAEFRQIAALAKELRGPKPPQEALETQIADRLAHCLWATQQFEDRMTILLRPTFGQNQMEVIALIERMSALKERELRSAARLVMVQELVRLRHAKPKITVLPGAQTKRRRKGRA